MNQNLKEAIDQQVIERKAKAFDVLIEQSAWRVTQTGKGKNWFVWIGDRMVGRGSTALNAVEDAIRNVEVGM